MPKVKQTRTKRVICSPYIKQPSRYSCGPTALYNLIKWRYDHKSHKMPKHLSYRQIHQMCDCKLPFGTEYKDFENTLCTILRDTKTSLRSLRMYDNVNFNQTTEHINKGGVALIEYYWNDPNGRSGEHYILIDKLNKENYSTKYNVVNPDDKAELSNTEQFITRREFQSTLKPYKYADGSHKDPYDDIYPKVWLIDKN